MLAWVRRVPAEGLLLGTVVLWSFNFTALRYGVTHEIEPLVYVSLRWLSGRFLLWVIVRLRGRSLRLGRRDLLLIALASIFGVVINQGCVQLLASFG
jgi:drug/metabolite transporter (DMT)-like permease